MIWSAVHRHTCTLTGCCFLKWHTFCWRSAWKPRVAPDLLPLDFSWGRQREVLSPLSRFSRFPSVHNKLSFWEVDTHIHTPLGFYILSCIDSPGKLDETLTERRKEISEAHRWSSVERLFFSLKKITLLLSSGRRLKELEARQWQKEAFSLLVNPASFHCFIFAVLHFFTLRATLQGTPGMEKLYLPPLDCRKNSQERMK